MIQIGLPNWVPDSISRHTARKLLILNYRTVKIVVSFDSSNLNTGINPDTTLFALMDGCCVITFKVE